MLVLLCGCMFFGNRESGLAVGRELYEVIIRRDRSFRVFPYVAASGFLDVDKMQIPCVHGQSNDVQPGNHISGPVRPVQAMLEDGSLCPLLNIHVVKRMNDLECIAIRDT